MSSERCLWKSSEVSCEGTSVCERWVCHIHLHYCWLATIGGPSTWALGLQELHNMLAMEAHISEILISWSKLLSLNHQAMARSIYEVPSWFLRSYNWTSKFGDISTHAIGRICAYAWSPIGWSFFVNAVTKRQNRKHADNVTVSPGVENCKPTKFDSCSSVDVI